MPPCPDPAVPVMAKEMSEEEGKGGRFRAVGLGNLEDLWDRVWPWPAQ